MQEVAIRQTASVPAELQEKVLLGGDLARLTPTERLSYYNAVCTSVGLNPLTRPFEYLILNEKMVLYARKDCTDQLRDLHGISVEIMSRDVVDGVCAVTVRAKNMTERIDESVGAVPFMKENGEWKTSANNKSYFKPDGTYSALSLADRSNAMMKAETKAKRRVTLSICGLGMFDESELDNVPEAKKLYHAEDVERQPLRTPSQILAESEARPEPIAADPEKTLPDDPAREIQEPAPLFKASTWVIQFGKSKGKLLSDVSDEDVDYLLKYYTGKLNDPANVNSRYRGEWEQAVIEVRGEMLLRYPEA